MHLYQYNCQAIGLFGLNDEFRQCHIPYVTVKDTYGVMGIEGSSGTGKTTLVKRLGLLHGKLTGGKVGIYSADKARYEDFLGCPIPNLETKTMDMFLLPHSMAQMETLGIDEINRASLDNQEKYLSICATREIDGLPTKCKYIFAMMNPIMPEDSGEVYEGVLPLDKALGERMMGLIQFPSFGKMDRENRKKVMLASFNQTAWEPSDEMVDLHREFLDFSIRNYEEYKIKFSDCIVDFVDKVQDSLRNESNGGVSIEARRAQFMLTNTLALHAINNAEEPDAVSLEQSAQMALLMSFPNVLWEKPVSKEALRQAFKDASPLLKKGPQVRSKTVQDENEIQTIMEELKKFTIEAPELPDREQLSKFVNQKIPPASHVLNHHMFAIGATHGIEIGCQELHKPERSSLKEQEFERINQIRQKLLDHPKAKVFAELGEIFYKSKELPNDGYVPFFVKADTSHTSLEEYASMTTLPDSRVILTLGEIDGVEFESVEHAFNTSVQVSEIASVFKEIELAYAKSGKV